MSLNDKTGPTEAKTATHKIVKLLQPDYILILGIAGGIFTRVKLGDVVVSRFLHDQETFSTNTGAARNQGINPPDANLHSVAYDIGQKEEWVERLSSDIKPDGLDPIEEEIRPNETPKFISDEILSSPLLFDDPNDSIQDKIFSLLPRLHAVEMEAGAVAKALAEEASERKIVPGYIVIKGISDVAVKKPIDEDLPPTSQSEDENKKIRKIWKPWAAHVSAVFARELVEEFQPSCWCPLPIMRVLPNPQHDTRFIDPTCCGVLRGIEPFNFSAIAAQHLARISQNLSVYHKVFFTFLPYPPVQFWKFAQKAYNNGNEESNDVSSETLTNWIINKFPHYKIFNAFAKKHPNECNRILLLPDDDSWKRGLTKEKWQFFVDLCGGPNLYAISQNYIVDRTTFFTDYAIMGDSLLFDYYEEASTLIVSDLSNGNYIAPNILELKKHFYDSNGQGPYIPYESLKKQAEEYLIEQRA